MTQSTRSPNIAKWSAGTLCARTTAHAKMHFGVRLISQSAPPRADVQPCGLRTLTLALACAVSLRRGSGRSATTSALVAAGHVACEGAP